MRIYHNKRIMAVVTIILSSIVFSIFPRQLIVSVFMPVDKEKIEYEIERIYNIRDSAFITGNLITLKDCFDTSQKYGQWSLEHEVRRVKYLNDWSKAREIKFTNVESYIRIKKVAQRERTIRVSLEESYKFDYMYPYSTDKQINSFGVGIRHTVNLLPRGEGYLIYSDWYTDCFEDAMQKYSGDIPESAVDTSMFKDEPLIDGIFTIVQVQKRFYDRQKAAAYADKYCGAAWGNGNNYKYNKKYRDYTGIGGDCTNFVSQVLGDKEGGGLPLDYKWRSDGSKYGNNSGTKAWVNADSFKNYILYSGKGSLIRKGTFNELTKPTSSNARGAVGILKIGDLVCYEKKGNIDHFAVVTGMDSNGYPLVNSHTTDRYHVPWDLGWGDSHIKFLLIHING